jgi:predicted transcriptional regulator
MLHREDPRTSELKSRLDVLANARASEHWATAETVAEQLVAWITDDADAGA